MQLCNHTWLPGQTQEELCVCCFDEALFALVFNGTPPPYKGLWPTPDTDLVHPPKYIYIYIYVKLNATWLPDVKAL